MVEWNFCSNFKEKLIIKMENQERIETGKILITGTGRCGTTFLIILYTKLEMDTGFDPNKIHSYLSKQCNSGMELRINSKHKVLKNPRFILDIAKIIRENRIKFIIVPERNYEEVSRSRERYGNDSGGFFGASNYENQLKFLTEKMHLFKRIVENSNVNVIYLDFYQMVQDPEYLYEKLLPTFDREITFDFFLEAYNFSTNLQKK